MYKVFADQHHMGLYNSLKILFEDRLGGELYRPIGKEWLDKDIWKIANIYNNHPATVAQYLGIPDNPIIEDGIYRIYDPQHDSMQRAITLDKFYEIRPDIVIASVPEHIESFKKLAESIGAKMIYQVGNAWRVEDGMAENVMASALMNNVPSRINLIEYHQEFPLSVFYPDNAVPENNIYSFVNCFNTASIYAKDWEDFLEHERYMTDWNFKSFGGSCRDGSANGQMEVANRMREAKFVWHVKWGGDGYGHIIYNSGAVGRPLIVKKQYYEGKMGAELMFDGETCLTIDGLNSTEIANKVNYFSNESRYKYLCENVYNNFRSKVNFSEEEYAIRKFLHNLI